MHRTFSFLLIGVLISVALMSFWSPYVGDDYIWLFTAVPDAPVGQVSICCADFDCLCRILKMVWVHYMTLNGRMLSYFLCGLLNLLSTWEYACCNAMVFVSLVWLFWKTTGLCRRWFLLVVFSIVSLLIQYEAVFWRSGSANYLWPTVILWAACLFGIKNKDISWVGGVALMPFAFVVAGGHELASLGVCAIVFVYWLVCFIKCRHVPINGLTILSGGFVLGSMALLFSPGTLRRASAAGMLEFGGSVLFFAAVFVRSMIRCVVACPPVVVVICFVFWVIMKRRWDLLIGRRYSYTLVCWGAVFFFTCSLTDGVGRTSWFLSVCSLLLLFMILGEFKDRISVRLINSCTVVLGAFAIGVLLLSTYQMRVAKSAYENMLFEWVGDGDGLFVGRQWRLATGLEWFDRTARLDSLLHFGAGYPNHLVAKAYQRNHLIRVTEDMRTALRAVDGIFATKARIPGNLNLHSIEGVDLIAIPYCGELPHGAPIRATISYGRKTELSFLERVRLRITREGATDACKNSPMEDMCGSGKQDGFIYKSVAHGVFAVVILNQGIPRDMIEDVRIEPCSVPLREAVLL